MITNFLANFLKDRGTYSLLGIAALTVVLKWLLGVDVVALVATSPEAQESIKALYVFLIGAALRRGMKKK